MAVLVALGTEYTIVDAQGHVVGSIVTDTPPGTQLRVVAVAGGARIKAAPQSDPRADRTFHPDYSRALSVEQVTRAWQAEMERIAPQPVTGGG
jgi:hypothetical protein